MDEILLNNFMVFSDLVERQAYDLWAGDEAWEVDHFLYENPELKRAAYAWLTDFVGWVPMTQHDDASTEREAALTADYNEEMIEQVDRLPRIRDHALFIGNPGDVVDTTFGPGLPRVRDWVGEHFTFTGYVTGMDDSEIAERQALRREFGFADASRSAWSPWGARVSVSVSCDGPSRRTSSPPGSSTGCAPSS